jgi:hypothetical protein
VVPASSSHCPINSSPRKGFSGFIFFLFPLSSLLLCCCLSVLKNHFKTNSARFSGSGSLAGAQKRVGCSAQYAEYSTMDCGERRNGGAVSDARSPLKVANDYRQSMPILFSMRPKGKECTLMNEKKALLCCGASFSDSHLLDMTWVSQILLAIIFPSSKQ